MKVAVIGTGYVGLVSGTCFAELGHEVLCVDINEKKVATLKQGKTPIYEPGLTDMLERNIRSKRLDFTCDYRQISSARVVFFAVDTPASDNGEADLSRLKSAVTSTSEHMVDGAILVLKSTVPVGTHQVVHNWLKELTSKSFEVVNNPEFLKEGTAVNDFMRPDRVIIGVHGQNGEKVMKELYAPLLRSGNPIYVMSNVSAEMTKYAANSFLATKISFINEVANLCDKTGADIDDVRRGMMSDPRIGKKFLYPGVGYGGSCFPKDVQALMATGKQIGMDMSIIEAAHKVNLRQKTVLFDKMREHFKDGLSGKTFAFWGVAFKPNTDDIREAPAIDMAQALVSAGARVQFYDPVASENFSEYMQMSADQLKCYSNKYDCLENADALVCLTEWLEFRDPDFELIAQKLKHKALFDGRNIFDGKNLRENGFHYAGIGKQA